MNKILADYVACVRKKLITDRVSGIDAAEAIALDVWTVLTTTSSRTLIRDNPALRQALELNDLNPEMKDAEFRDHLKEADNRNG